MKVTPVGRLLGNPGRIRNLKCTIEAYRRRLRSRFNIHITAPPRRCPSDLSPRPEASWPGRVSAAPPPAP